MSRRRFAILVALVVVALAGLALARPGGGNSFSGGGGHSSGGGGGYHSSGGGGSGGGEAIFELIYWTLRLLIYYPQIGLPLLVVVIVVIAWSSYQKHQNRDWDSGPHAELERSIAPTEIRRVDPDFSVILFEDFAFRLFATAQRARSSADALATIAPYVNDKARDALARREPVGVAVEQAVVGALRVTRVDVPPSQTDAEGRPWRARVAVQFEANVMTAQHTYYSVETWLFGRDARRTTRPPDPTRRFPCPNCGAPWEAKRSGTQQCASCGQIVDNGRFDWSVESIALASMDERPPTLTENVQERGNDLPTYLQPGVTSSWAQLLADDPALAETAVRSRLALIYNSLNPAWTRCDLTPVRGLVTDGLYDYLQYWVDAYKRQGLRNELVDMRITAAELAKVTRDRWYDAVTFRVFATGKDFTVRTQTGALVTGSKNRERQYTEYWTLVRSAARKGPARTDPACSNCGAPLKITMSGACEHCGAHVTAGEFDWVLSKIEQDDTYRG